MLDLVCGTCGQPIQMPERAIGHRARCRGCGMEFVVPALAVGGPRVVKPVGEPEMNWSQAANTPPAEAVDLGLGPVDASPASLPLRPLAPPPRTPISVRTPEQTQEQLDAQFLDQLEAERRRHIQTGQYTPFQRRSPSQRGSRLTVAVIGGMMGVAAIVVLVYFLFRACNYQERLFKEPPPPPNIGRPSVTPAQPAQPPRPTPSPRPVQPVTPAQPEAMLSVLGRPEYGEEAELSWGLVSGFIINRYSQPVEEATVVVTMRTDDGQAYNRFGTTVTMIPPNSTAPFTIRIDDVQGGRAAEPRAEDYTVTGRPNGENDWVPLRVLTPPRVDEQTRRVSGDVENSTDPPSRVAHIRVMCDLYAASGVIVLRKEAQMRDPNVILRPGTRDSFTFQWTSAETGDDLLADKMTVRAMARRLGD